MDEIAELKRAFTRRILFFGIPASILIAVYYGVWGPLRGNDTVANAVVSNALSAVFFTLVLSGLLYVRFLRGLEGEAPWITEDRPPTAEERERLVGTAPRIASNVLRYLLLMAVVIGTGNYISEGVPAETARIVVGLVLTAFTFSAISYLMIESALRPLYAKGLVDGAPPPAGGIGVRLRLVLAWALGSGIPLLFVLAIPLGYVEEGDTMPMAVPVVFMAIIGLLAGSVTTLLVSRSVADPIEAVRDGLRRVGAGDVDAEVAVDDPGEIGLLQSGFNEMVAGLRERRRLEDLFGRHVGEDVARNAVARGVALGGEVREVSALFVDLIGSTAMTESLAPNAVVATLNSFFDAVVDAVTAEGGWVNKFEGDGALCVFGAPAEDPEHASHALRSARALHAALARLGLDAGTGVSTGEAVAGNVGTEQRYEYTVIGRPVNEAARLTDEAKRRPGRVLASDAAVCAAGAEASNWRASGSLELRGLSVPLRVCEPA